MKENVRKPGSEPVMCPVCDMISIHKELQVFESTRPEYDMARISKEERNTLVQHCPNCGLSLMRLDEDLLFSEEILTTESYRMPQVSEDSRPFLQAALIYLNSGHVYSGARYLVYGAQLETDPLEKMRCYINAALALDSHMRRREERLYDEDCLFSIDVYRRAGLWKHGYELAMKWENEMGGILKFMVKAEKHLLEAHDRTEYSYLELVSISAL